MILFEMGSCLLKIRNCLDNFWQEITYDFFLEHAGELRVISLIDRKKGPITSRFHGWGYV
jgi:hypothetical protein